MEHITMSVKASASTEMFRNTVTEAKPGLIYPASA